MHAGALPQIITDLLSKSLETAAIGSDGVWRDVGKGPGSHEVR